MTFDFVIIGSGPAGSILAWRLAKLNFNIALVDQANSKKKIINDYFLPYVNKSPNHYNPVFSNRLGGNSILWHSKVYLISEKHFINNSLNSSTTRCFFQRAYVYRLPISLFS